MVCCVAMVPTLDALADRPLAEMVARLVKAFEPLKIDLFGSRARGEARPDSDYDLLLVVPDDAPAPRRRSRLAYEALRGKGVAADVLVRTRSYFDSHAAWAPSLPATVLREGKLLYERAADSRSRDEALAGKGVE